MQPSSVGEELRTAQKTLADLQDDLPQFHSLLAENEADVQRLKTEHASLDAQAQARGRVGVAKEMLEQHQSDIATAQAEVSLLEQLERREAVLLDTAGHAEAGLKHETEFNAVLASLHKALETGLQKLLAEYDTATTHRKAFDKAARDPALAAELEAQGVKLAGFSPVLPTPYGPTLWRLFDDVIRTRAYEAINAERSQRAAEREAQRPKPPALREIALPSSYDVEAASKLLGDLVCTRVRHGNGHGAGGESYGINVEESRLAEAVALLRGKISHTVLEGASAPNLHNL